MVRHVQKRLNDILLIKVNFLNYSLIDRFPENYQYVVLLVNQMKQKCMYV